MGNGYGKIYRLTTYGESHGLALGGVIEGCPAGVRLDMEEVEKEMARRRPGQSGITTARKERDEVEFVSGLYEGRTTGTAIGFVIRNEDARSEDYAEMENKYRPSHADYTYEKKYGIRDPRGGGRASARETAARCVGGAVAKQVLREQGVEIKGYTSAVGEIRLERGWEDYDLSMTENNAVRCPDVEKALEMEALIRKVRSEGDTVGGVVTCVAEGVPAGLGEPVFDKLSAVLAHGMLSIPGAKGFEYGDGFKARFYKGSAHNDIFVNEGGEIRTKTNYSGGIQGGISNGEAIYFRVVFKAAATVMRVQETVTRGGEWARIEGRGRHDACVVPRAVSVVEAMCAMTVLDMMLRQKVYV
jgi:chorismate synthase